MSHDEGSAALATAAVCHESGSMNFSTVCVTFYSTYFKKVLEMFSFILQLPVTRNKHIIYYHMTKFYDLNELMENE
jgi:hypothetical protein